MNIGIDFEEYVNLENKNTALIEKENLPVIFCDGAYYIIVDFIQKTRGLDNEWVIFFDYCTGEILKCVKGICNKVNVEFLEGEFEGYHVASIHNHPEDVLSPPSGKNFGILTRDFEDYELIAGYENFWILKAIGLHKNLVDEFNHVSDMASLSSFLHCIGRYNDDVVFNRMHDLRYGVELLKYINNKNIKDIQLTKSEYVRMNNNSNNVEYECRKRITNPEVIKFAREFENNPFTPTGKDIMYNFYKRMGMDVDYDEIFTD